MIRSYRSEQSEQSEQGYFFKTIYIKKIYKIYKKLYI